MRVAFSAPDRDPPEREALMAGFPAHGFDGLQLKRMQYETFLDDPAVASGIAGVSGRASRPA